MSTRPPTWGRKKLPGMTLELTLADRESRVSTRRGSILSAAAGCLLLQALRTQITMSGFPEVLDALPSKFWEKEPTPFIFYTKYRC